MFGSQSLNIESHEKRLLIYKHVDILLKKSMQFFQEIIKAKKDKEQSKISNTKGLIILSIKIPSG